MTYKTKRSRATDIPIRVKKAVAKRDYGLCIFCGRHGYPNAHYIPRSHGGLGIEQNIVTACVECHERMDHTTDRKIYLDAARRYLRERYADWSEDKLTYKKEKAWEK